MKRFFLYAVAITALCSSCETETNKQSNTLHQAKGVQANDYQTYQSILNSFEYNHQQTYQENLLLFEEHVNRQMLNYVPKETYKYEKIDTEQLLVLQQVDADYIEKLVYTKPTKQAIYAIIGNRFNSDMVELITNESERNLIETLFALNSNGNGDDDKWNGKRNIAFAVLYAGAIELSVK